MLPSKPHTDLIAAKPVKESKEVLRKKNKKNLKKLRVLTNKHQENYLFGLNGFNISQNLFTTADKFFL